MATPLSNPDLLASIRRERARLDELIAGLSPQRLSEPGLDGERSVKDVLAHICAWEKIGMAVVRNNQALPQPAPGDDAAAGQGQTDAINDNVYQDNRDRPVADVLADAQQSHAELVAMVEAMSQEQLESPLGGQQFAGESPRAGEVISSNSDGHYREHIDQIEAWLRERPR